MKGNKIILAFYMELRWQGGVYFKQALSMFLMCYAGLWVSVNEVSTVIIVMKVLLHVSVKASKSLFNRASYLLAFVEYFIVKYRII
jgi:hypothetical protein